MTRITIWPKLLYCYEWLWPFRGKKDKWKEKVTKILWKGPFQVLKCKFKALFLHPFDTTKNKVNNYHTFISLLRCHYLLLIHSFYYLQSVNTFCLSPITLHGQLFCHWFGPGVVIFVLGKVQVHTQNIVEFIICYATTKRKPKPLFQVTFIVKYWLLNPNRAGGGGGIPPPLYVSRRELSWLFSLKYCTTFGAIFGKIGRTIPKLRDIM